MSALTARGMGVPYRSERRHPNVFNHVRVANLHDTSSLGRLRSMISRRCFLSFSSSSRLDLCSPFAISVLTSLSRCGSHVCCPALSLPTARTERSGDGHSALLQGLGAIGDVPPALMPWLLRLAHVRSGISGGDSAASLQSTAGGTLLWKAALERGLIPDDATLFQFAADKETIWHGADIESLQWPEEPLRGVLVRTVSRLGVGRFTQRYPAVKDVLLKSLLELIVKYHKTVNGEMEVEERAVDEHGNVFLTATELAEQERARRAKVAESKGDSKAGREYRDPNVVPSKNPPSKSAKDESQSTSMHVSAAGKKTTSNTGNEQGFPIADTDVAELQGDIDENTSADTSSWSRERRIAEDLVSDFIQQWQKPMATLQHAGRAFTGLESLLAGAGFDLNGSIWGRRGWAEMDSLREKLEDIKELRDLVRSLGRGGGWGPLRRAPVQRLDMRGRPGLLRTTLEAQETRGLTRSDDISRLLPSEAALLARGRSVRQAKLLFFARHAEKGLQTYERDGWGEFPTAIIHERREIRPTADRGPILLCVDTSGSMRGPREMVAKALALECMRAAQAQERGCYVYAFAGPQDVRELELNMDTKSITNLLDFLEKTFNGGSDFNAPIKRCLDRLTDSKWGNSDILLVSDGELRQPGPEIMRKLAGAKDKLGLRVHGLIVGDPENKRADPAVLRSLCSHRLSQSGKMEVLVHQFESWSSVQADTSLRFDWDDSSGNKARREAGLRLEKLRQEEMKRRRRSAKDRSDVNRKAVRMPTKNTTSFE